MALRNPWAVHFGRPASLHQRRNRFPHSLYGAGHVALAEGAGGPAHWSSIDLGAGLGLFLPSTLLSGGGHLEGADVFGNDARR